MNERRIAALFGLEGRVALVTGGAGHLGRAMACILADAGAHVYVAGRTRRSLDGVVEKMRASELRATALTMDVTSDDSVAEALKRVGDESGRLDIVVNNAYVGGTGALSQVSPDAMLRTYDVTTVAAHRIVTGALDLLRRAAAESGEASIVNIASMYALVSPDPRLYDGDEQRQPPDYGPAKASLIQYSRYLAIHLAGDGIRVNTLSPGPFPRTTDQAFLQRLRNRVPLGRAGEPDELKGAVLFLASKASTFVTGSNLVVDGGWTAW